MPAFISIQSLSCPVNAIRVRLPYRKLAIALVSYSGKPFFLRIARSLSWGTLSNAPARSRLSINTTHPRRARYVVSTYIISSLTTDSVDLLRLAPI